MILSISPLSGLRFRGSTQPKFVSIFNGLYSVSRSSLLQYQQLDSDDLVFDQTENGVYVLNSKTRKCFYYDADGRQRESVENNLINPMVKRKSYSNSKFQSLKSRENPKLNKYTFFVDGAAVLSFSTKDSLLNIIGDEFIFFSRKECRFSKFNSKFEEISCLKYSANLAICNVFEDVAILYCSDSSENHVEIIDMSTFDSIFVVKTIVEAPLICEVIPASEFFFYRCGKLFYFWNGKTLQQFFPDKLVVQCVVKDDFVYILFDNDPVVYAFSSSLQTVLRQRSLPILGLTPFSIRTTTNENYFYTLKVDGGAFRGLSYVGAWTDEEFFSDDEIPVVYEEKIFIEKPTLNEAGFSLDIVVSATEDYGTVFRQALAALDEAILVHAFDKAKVSYSKEFDGCIRLLIEKSSWMSKAERSQLTDACEELMRFVFMTGAATGNDCTCAVEFTDS